MIECLFTNQVVVGSSPVAVTQTSDIAHVSNKNFLNIQATIECGFTLKRVRDMIKTYSTNSEFSFIGVWFTDQNNKPLEIENNMNVILITGTG